MQAVLSAFGETRTELRLEERFELVDLHFRGEKAQRGSSIQLGAMARQNLECRFKLWIAGSACGFEIELEELEEVTRAGIHAVLLSKVVPLEFVDKDLQSFAMLPHSAKHDGSGFQ